MSSESGNGRQKPRRKATRAANRGTRFNNRPSAPEAEVPAPPPEPPRYAPRDGSPFWANAQPRTDPQAWADTHLDPPRTTFQYAPRPATTGGWVTQSTTGNLTPAAPPPVPGMPTPTTHPTDWTKPATPTPSRRRARTTTAAAEDLAGLGTWATPTPADPRVGDTASRDRGAESGSALPASTAYAREAGRASTPSGAAADAAYTRAADAAYARSGDAATRQSGAADAGYSRAGDTASRERGAESGGGLPASTSYAREAGRAGGPAGADAASARSAFGQTAGSSALAPEWARVVEDEGVPADAGEFARSAAAAARASEPVGRAGSSALGGPRTSGGGGSGGGRVAARAAKQPGGKKRVGVAALVVLLVGAPITWLLVHQPNKDQVDSSIPIVTSTDDRYVTPTTQPVDAPTTPPATPPKTPPPTPSATPTATPTDGVTPTTPPTGGPTSVPTSAPTDNPTTTAPPPPNPTDPTPTQPTTSKPPPPQPPPDDGDMRELELDLFKRINDARISNGCAALKRDSSVTHGARGEAQNRAEDNNVNGGDTSSKATVGGNSMSASAAFDRMMSDNRSTVLNCNLTTLGVGRGAADYRDCAVVVLICSDRTRVGWVANFR